MSDLPTRTTTSTPQRAAGRGATRSETLTATVELDFPEFLVPPPEPMALLASWLESSTSHGVREPRAIALATADAQGRTSSRTVAVNAVTDAGLVFITHSGSRKGRELAENPWASGVLYWRETSRQISLAGPVRWLSRAEAEALWFARPVFTHPMTSVSRQSEPLSDLDEFAELRAKALALGVPERPLPCPETFVAFRLEPASVEFWANGTDRLHERLRYDRVGDSWRISRLQP